MTDCPWSWWLVPLPFHIFPFQGLEAFANPHLCFSIWWGNRWKDILKYWGENNKNQGQQSWGTKWKIKIPQTILITQLLRLDSGEIDGPRLTLIFQLCNNENDWASRIMVLAFEVLCDSSALSIPARFLELVDDPWFLINWGHANGSVARIPPASILLFLASFNFSVSHFLPFMCCSNCRQFSRWCLLPSRNNCTWRWKSPGAQSWEQEGLPPPAPTNPG